MDAENKTRRHCLLTVVTLSLWLVGCATEPPRRRVAPPPSAPGPARSPVGRIEPSAPDPILQTAAAQRSAPFDGAGWQSLFDGRSLAGWQVTDFTGHGAARCESGLIVIESGVALSGINWTNNVPKMNYEIALDAMKLQGSDFFCGLTFPVGDSHCSLILGGWGGSVTGLSSIDDQDAAENELTHYIKYELNKWYRVRVRVTDAKIEAWLDAEKIVDLNTAGHRIGLRFGEIELSKPLGVATYQTRAALREIKIRLPNVEAKSRN